jgi:putative ABC transport system permease protein
VTAVGEARSGIDGDRPQSVDVATIDPSTYFDVEDLFITKGPAKSELVKRLSSSASLVVPVSLAASRNLSVGSKLALRTRGGVADFVVAGVYRTAFDNPPIYMSRSAAARWFGVTSATDIHIATDGDVELVRREVTSLQQGGLFTVSTTGSSKDELRALLRTFLSVFIVILALGAVVGALGLAVTIAAVTLDRTREIGVLRSIGAGDGGIVRVVLGEALTLTAAAFVLALPAAVLLARILLRLATTAVGAQVDLVLPWSWVVGTGLVGLVVAAGASAWPAYRACRIDTELALRWD